MNITVAWDNTEETVVRLTLLDHWSWEELYEANKQVAAWMENSDQTIYVLLDYTQTRDVPVGGLIMHMRNVLSAYPANWGMTFVVTKHMLVQRLFGIFQTTYQAELGRKVRLVASVKEVYQWLEKFQRTNMLA